MKTPKYHLKKKEMKNKSVSFSFGFVTKKTILNQFSKLKRKMVCQERDIPVKIIKESLDIVSIFAYNNFNNFLFCFNFPVDLKKYKHTAHFENVENYLPVSNLPNLSKVFESCMYI